MPPLKIVSIQMAFGDQQRGNEGIYGFLVKSRLVVRGQPRKLKPLNLLQVDNLKAEHGLLGISKVCNICLPLEILCGAMAKILNQFSHVVFAGLLTHTTTIDLIEVIRKIRARPAISFVTPLWQQLLFFFMTCYELGLFFHSCLCIYDVS